MKLNNKGFIAISLIYSFFLVFLITLLAIVSNYAQNRVLLNDVKKETQEYLNELAAFNPVYLKSKKNDDGVNIPYEPFDEVKFGSNDWVVINEDNEGNVTLILKRTLTQGEIATSLSNIAKTLNDDNIMNAINEENNEKTLMCLDTYDSNVCSYGDSTGFNKYYWSNSIVQKIVNEWLLNDTILQKAISPSIGSMQRMTYSDGVSTEDYNNYIRIPLSSEFNIIKDEDTWYLTFASLENGISTIECGSDLVNAHTIPRTIRPVIMVKKTT